MTSGIPLTTGFSHTPPDRFPRLAVIDLLRIFAACAVMVFHLTSHPFPDAPAFPELWNVTVTGMVGVNIFFVISGFVIAWSAEGLKAGEFVWRRFLRLAPALFLCSLPAFALKLLRHGLIWPAVSALLHTWILWPTGPWVDGVYWTLTVEVAFYGLIAAIIALGLAPRLEAAAAIWLVIGLLWDFPATRRMVAPVPISYFLPVHYVAHFALGVFLMLWLRKGATALRLAAIGLATAGCICEMHPRLMLAEQFWPQALVWGAAMLALILGVRFERIIWRRPAPAWLATLGLATYPLYLLHNMCGGAVSVALFHFGFNRWICLVAAILASIAGSLIVTVVIEPRLRAGLKILAQQAASRLPRLKPA